MISIIIGQGFQSLFHFINIRNELTFAEANYALITHSNAVDSLSNLNKDLFLFYTLINNFIYPKIHEEISRELLLSLCASIMCL